MVVAIIGNFERSLNAIYLVALALQTVQAAITGIVAVPRVRHNAGVVLATFVNVVVVFIIAEAAPKTWALQHTDRAALATAPLIVAIGRTFRWIADLLITITNVILPGKGLEQGPFVTEEEIIALMGEAAEASVIEEEERDLIESIIDFGDTVAREIMVPRTDMVSFEVDYHVADCVEIAILNGLSRFPVYRDNIDDVVGIVYAKDLMRAERDQRGERDHRGSHAHAPTSCRRPSASPNCSARCRRGRPTSRWSSTSTAGTAGLVTMEDLLEELVGDIADEFDQEIAPGRGAAGRRGARARRIVQRRRPERPLRPRAPRGRLGQASAASCSPSSVVCRSSATSWRSTGTASRCRASTAAGWGGSRSWPSAHDEVGAE